jgi:hypothetical protein
MDCDLSGIRFPFRGATFVVEPAYALLTHVCKEVEGDPRGVVEKAYSIKVGHGLVLLLQVLNHFEWDREVYLQAIPYKLTFEGP